MEISVGLPSHQRLSVGWTRRIASTERKAVQLMESSLIAIKETFYKAPRSPGHLGVIPLTTA